MKRLGLFVCVCGVLLLLPSSVVAGGEPVCEPGEILPPCTCTGNCALTDFVQLFINLFTFGVQVAAPLAVFFIIIGAVILVTASGYSNRIDLGKTIITQAVTGLIIVLISWVVVDTAIFLITGDRTIFSKPWYKMEYPMDCKDDYIYQGCTGGNVSAIQNNLVALGYTIPSEAFNTYGPETVAAVRKFQEDMNYRVYREVAAEACDGKPEGVVVWNFAFGQSCSISPASGTCVLPTATIMEKRLSNSGAADKKTQEALDGIQKNVASDFKTACKT